MKTLLAERKIMFTDLSAICCKIYDLHKSGQYYCTVHELKFLPKLDESVSITFTGEKNNNTVISLINHIKHINPTVGLTNEFDVPTIK
ncbi:MAG: hypothetical protein HY819_07820 [Acidobacteria bacterium]|nr:hypothetical protein [Acidobacteriota bacterium]